jgi:hypothetical protein
VEPPKQGDKCEGSPSAGRTVRSIKDHRSYLRIPHPPRGNSGPRGVSGIAQDLIPSLAAAERFFSGLFFESLSRRVVSRNDGSSCCSTIQPAAKHADLLRYRAFAPATADERRT